MRDCSWKSLVTFLRSLASSFPPNVLHFLNFPITGNFGGSVLCGQVSNATAGWCPGKDSKQLVLQRLEKYAFARLEHWSGLPFPPAGDLPDPGIEPTSPALAGGFFTTEPPGKLSSTSRWRVKNLFLLWHLKTHWFFGENRSKRPLLQGEKQGTISGWKFKPLSVLLGEREERLTQNQPQVGGGVWEQEQKYWERPTSETHRTCPRLKQKQGVRDPALTPMSLAPKSKLWEYPLGRGADMLGWLKRWGWSRNTEKYRNTEKPSDTWSPL